MNYLHIFLVDVFVMFKRIWHIKVTNSMDIDSTLFVFNCVIDITVVIFMLKDNVSDKDYEKYCNAFQVQ